MKYQAYKEYKDSGVEWLGDIPKHWEASLIKYLSTEVSTGGTPKNLNSFSDDKRVCWFAPGDFRGSEVISDSAKYVTPESCESGDAKLFSGGSVIVIGIGATLGKVGYSPDHFSCNQQVNVIAPNQRIFGMFLMHSLSVQHEQMKQLSNASTIGIMNQEKTKILVIALPPKNEQLNIIMKRQGGYLTMPDTRVLTLIVHNWVTSATAISINEKLVEKFADKEKFAAASQAVFWDKDSKILKVKFNWSEDVELEIK